MSASEENEELISPEALQDQVEITTYKSSGPGGQKKNKTESSVRIKHIPTGIIVIATESRSQHKNRELAWQRLIEKLQRRERKPAPRRPTKIPRAVREGRLHEKKARAQKKELRKPPESDE